MQIRSTEISYKSKSQNLAFRSTYLRSFEGQSSLRMSVLLRAWDQSCVAFNFFVFLHPLEKELPMHPPLPSEISAFEPPSPSEFPVTFRGGVWIFSGTTHFLRFSTIDNSIIILIFII